MRMCGWPTARQGPASGHCPGHCLTSVSQAVCLQTLIYRFLSNFGTHYVNKVSQSASHTSRPATPAAPAARGSGVTAGQQLCPGSAANQCARCLPRPITPPPLALLQVYTGGLVSLTATMSAATYASLKSESYSVTVSAEVMGIGGSSTISGGSTSASATNNASSTLGVQSEPRRAVAATWAALHGAALPARPGQALCRAAGLWQRAHGRPVQCQGWHAAHAPSDTRKERKKFSLLHCFCHCRSHAA